MPKRVKEQKIRMSTRKIKSFNVPTSKLVRDKNSVRSKMLVQRREFKTCFEKSFSFERRIIQIFENLHLHLFQSNSPKRSAWPIFFTIMPPMKKSLKK